jgi:hypothetical protein
LARVNHSTLSDVLANERCRRAMLAAAAEELLANRIADGANRGSEVRKVVNAEEAADFLRLSPTAFRKLAPSLPRCQIYERSGYRYLRSDLLTWLRVRGNAAQTGPHLEALGGTKSRKVPPKRGVKRLI